MRSRRMPGWPPPGARAPRDTQGGAFQDLWVAAESLHSSLLGRNIQGGVYVGEGSNQGPFPMESWGSRLGDSAGDLISL